MDNPFKIYSWGSTDGYTHTTEGYCETEMAAQARAKEKYGGYGVVGFSPLWAVKIGDKTYILSSEHPIYLESDLKVRDAIRTQALQKLSTVERDVLGIK